MDIHTYIWKLRSLLCRYDLQEKLTSTSRQHQLHMNQELPIKKVPYRDKLRHGVVLHSTKPPLLTASRILRAPVADRFSTFEMFLHSYITWLRTVEEITWKDIKDPHCFCFSLELQYFDVMSCFETNYIIYTEHDKYCSVHTNTLASSFRLEKKTQTSCNCAMKQIETNLPCSSLHSCRRS